MNNVAYFEIQASNPEALITFYSEIFGWEFNIQEGMPLRYWGITTGGMRGGLMERPFPKAPEGVGTNAFTCSIQVEDYDACEAAILSHDGVIAVPKMAVPGKCWQGYYVDTDSNVFGIFEVDERAK